MIPRPVRHDMSGLRRAAGVSLPDAVLVQALMAWTNLIGAISFELFGHLHNIVNDHDSYFEMQMRNIGRDLGLEPGSRR